MTTWSPLWSMVVTSSLWGESKEVRILFVTMLALKDANGMVTSTISGLKRMANLETVEECAEAMKILESPDTRSDHVQEFDGRRVERVEGGWLILNHVKYRDMMQAVKKKTDQARWQRNYRDRIKAKKTPNVVEQGARNKEAESREESVGAKTIDAMIDAGEKVGNAMVNAVAGAILGENATPPTNHVPAAVRSVQGLVRPGGAK